MTVELAEKILVDKFRQEPFHTLYLLNNINPSTTKYGGTCSDKTLSYLSSAKVAKLEAYLHTAYIQDQEIHRLIRLEIDNQRYFADVGNGWPSLKLYPAFKEIEYSCFGMRYRTQIEKGIIYVFHLRQGIEKLQMKIDIKEKDDAKINKAIAQRFTSNIIYPFSRQLRFSLIVGNRFLFIRDTFIEVYHSQGYKTIAFAKEDNLQAVIQTYFDYDISLMPIYPANS